MVLRVHKVPHPGLAEEEGQQLTPPTSCLGLQSVLLQFNQRSYRRVVEYVRGVKNVHARSPHCGPAPKQSAVRVRIKPCKRWRTDQTVQTFPRGSDELNFGYHVRTKPLTCTTSRPSRETLSAMRVPETSDFSRSHARIGITTILHNAPQLHYSLHPTHTIHSSPSRGPWARQPLPKSSRTVLVLRCPKGICKKSLLTKIPFHGSHFPDPKI